nr:unnamed protein product [Digitaria exilis]
MRDFWELPPEEELVYSGPDWLLLVLDRYDDLMAALVVVIRDTGGLPLLMACRTLAHCHDATESEALACLEGIRMGAVWPDREFVVEMLRLEGPNRSVIAPIIHDTQLEADHLSRVDIIPEQLYSPPTTVQSCGVHDTRTCRQSDALQREERIGRAANNIAKLPYPTNRRFLGVHRLHASRSECMLAARVSAGAESGGSSARVPSIDLPAFIYTYYAFGSQKRSMRRIRLEKAMDREHRSLSGLSSRCLAGHACQTVTTSELPRTADMTRAPRLYMSALISRSMVHLHERDLRIHAGNFIIVVATSNWSDGIEEAL